MKESGPEAVPPADFFFSSRRRHTRCYRDWSSDVCSSDLEAELLREGRAQALVEPPVLDGVGRAGVETARAGLADTELLGELAVRLERGVGEDDGRVAARPRFLRQKIQLEADGAEPG